MKQFALSSVKFV